MEFKANDKVIVRCGEAFAGRVMEDMGEWVKVKHPDGFVGEFPKGKVSKDSIDKRIARFLYKLHRSRM